MKKCIAFFLTLALVSGILAGCGGGGGTPATQGDSESQAESPVTDSTPDVPEGKQTIIMWNWFADQWGPAVGEAFMALHPEYHVEAVNIPSGELETRILTGTTAQTGLPDVSCMQGDSIQRFIQFGALHDMTDWVQPYVGNFPGYKVANNTGPDGKIYGIPLDSGPCALFYSIELAEKAGVDPATDFATYESWLACGAKYDAIGVKLHRMTQNGDGGWAFMLTQQQNQSVFDEDGNAMFNTKEFINAVTMVKDLWDSGYAGEWDEWGPHYPDAVIGKEVGTIIAPAWYMNVFIHSFGDARDWDIVPMPTFPGSSSRTSNGGGSDVVIPLYADNPDLGWKVAEYYCADVDGRLVAMNALGDFPSYIPIYDLQEVADIRLPYFGDKPVFIFFSKLLPEIPDWRTPSPYIPVRDMVGAEFPKVMSGEMTPTEFAAHVQTMAEAIVRDFE